MWEEDEFYLSIQVKNFCKEDDFNELEIWTWGCVEKAYFNSNTVKVEAINLFRRFKILKIDEYEENKYNIGDHQEIGDSWKNETDEHINLPLKYNPAQITKFYKKCKKRYEKLGKRI